MCFQVIYHGGKKMDINLEKIELVKDRTGVSYNEAKEALENNDGSVVDAIVSIEEQVNEESEAGLNFKDSQAFKKIKEIVEKGNISQIKIKKNGITFVNFPVTVGVLGVVLVPWVAVLGAVAALGAHCEIELIDDKGLVVDVNEKATEVYDKAKEYADIALSKGEELKDKLMDLKELL